MQGIYIDGRRPKSKKAIKEAVQTDVASVRIEATSMYGNEYDGPVNDLPVGTEVAFVGPDPYSAHNFYGSLTRSADGKVNVK